MNTLIAADNTAKTGNPVCGDPLCVCVEAHACLCLKHQNKNIYIYSINLLARVHGGGWLLIKGEIPLHTHFIDTEL